MLCLTNAPICIFLKSCRQRVRVAGFKENEIFRFITFRPLDGEVHAIFTRNAFKGMDIGIVDLDVGHALILPCKLSDRLLAMRHSQFAVHGVKQLCYAVFHYPS